MNDRTNQYREPERTTSGELPSVPLEPVVLLHDSTWDNDALRPILEWAEAYADREKYERILEIVHKLQKLGVE